MIGSFDRRYLLRLALGAIFVYAAAVKIPDIGAFALEVHNYRMLPVPIENLFTMSLVWVELVVGAALVLNVTPRSAVVLGFLLLGAFFVAIAQAVLRNLDIECGCFGTADASRVGWIALARDAGMLVMAWLGYPRR